MHNRLLTVSIVDEEEVRVLPLSLRAPRMRRERKRSKPIEFGYCTYETLNKKRIKEK